MKYNIVETTNLNFGFNNSCFSCTEIFNQLLTCFYPNLWNAYQVVQTFLVFVEESQVLLPFLQS